MNVKQLKEALDTMAVTYASKAKKTELEALFAANVEDTAEIAPADSETEEVATHGRTNVVSTRTVEINGREWTELTLTDGSTELV
jgi:hypothetical protein